MLLGEPRDGAENAPGNVGWPRVRDLAGTRPSEAFQTVAQSPLAGSLPQHVFGLGTRTESDKVVLAVLVQPRRATGNISWANRV